MFLSLVFPERNVSSPASSSQAVTPAPAQEEADAEEENRQGTLQDQDMRQGVFCLHKVRGTYLFDSCYMHHIVLSLFESSEFCAWLYTMPL